MVVTFWPDLVPDNTTVTPALLVVVSGFKFVLLTIVICESKEVLVTVLPALFVVLTRVAGRLADTTVLSPFGFVEVVLVMTVVSALFTNVDVTFVTVEPALLVVVMVMG